MYVSFWGDEWSILGRMREASDEVCDEAEVVHSLRMVVLCAMQELVRASAWLAWIQPARYVTGDNALDQRRGRR